MKYNWFAIQLVIVCVIVFIFQIIYEPLTDQFALVSAVVLANPWTIVTSIFLHGSFEHLFYNMFALGLFGSVLERIIGGKKFLILFFVSGVIAGMGSVLFYTASIGASGAIFGIIGTLGILRPGMRVYMGYGVPMPMAIAVVLWAIGDLVGLFAPSEVANAAHLFGLAFGLILGFYLRKQYKETQIKRKEPKIDEEEFEEWEDEWM
jgi:membrane associated rhomboid family serine protease